MQLQNRHWAQSPQNLTHSHFASACCTTELPTSLSLHQLLTSAQYQYASLTLMYKCFFKSQCAKRRALLRGLSRNNENFADRRLLDKLQALCPSFFTKLRKINIVMIARTQQPRSYSLFNIRHLTSLSETDTETETKFERLTMRLEQVLKLNFFKIHFFVIGVEGEYETDIKREELCCEKQFLYLVLCDELCVSLNGCIIFSQPMLKLSFELQTCDLI